MVERFFFEGTVDKPRIDFDPQNNLFEITGNSYPEESPKFYIPLIYWITEYVKNPNHQTNLICKLEYFNSLSAKLLYELFFEFEKIKLSGNTISVSWFYKPDDSFILEKGEEYKNVLAIPFNLIAY